MRRLTLLARIFLVVCAASLAEAQTVYTTSGAVAGSAGKIETFLGIPYAAPPVASLRWAPPQAAAPWSGVRSAKHFAPHCAQVPSVFGRPSGSEDCLYLNVYTPGHSGNRRPVMVWVHGGAFNYGESDDYDGSSLASTGNVVVVTLNYRLGAFGFLAHPALAAEPGNVDGNYGLLDQQAAFRWVKENIAAFGGDPTNVTIFGESAGGSSVSAQVASPLAAGLFHKAIVESGFYDPGLLTVPQAETNGLQFAIRAGCPLQTTACLRNLPVASILNAANQPTPAWGLNALESEALFGPVRGTAVLPKTPIAAFASGEFNHVPVLNGTNHDELTGLLAIGIDTRFNPLDVSGYTQQGVLTVPLSAAVYAGFLGGNLRAAAALAATLVPGKLLAPQAAKYGTDAIFSCTARLADRSLARSVPVYAYEFNVEDSKTLLVPPSPNLAYGATHTNELGYLYPTFPSQFPSLGRESYTPAQATLAHTMQLAWTNFARSSDPNGPGVPAWPLYSHAADTFESLVAPEPTLKTTFAIDHNCAVFDPFDAGLADVPISILGDL